MLASYFRMFKGNFCFETGNFYKKNCFLKFAPSPESGNAKTGYKDRNNKPITKWFVKYILNLMMDGSHFVISKNWYMCNFFNYKFAKFKGNHLKDL